MKPVGFHVVFVFRKAVMFIRNDEPQNVPSGFTDLLQPYAAVLIDTGDHMGCYLVLYPLLGAVLAVIAGLLMLWLLWR